MENRHSDIVQVVHDYMSDRETAWRIGDRAIFAHDADSESEMTLDHAGGTLVSVGGAVRIAVNAAVRLVPAEALTADAWAQAGLLCLREADAAMAGRSALTELGSDMLAARPQDRVAILFDLGLGTPSVDCCVRTADTALCAALRAREGDTADAALYEAIDAAGADYVAVCRLGRIERFGSRPPPLPPLGVAPPENYAASLAFVPPQPNERVPFDEATYGAFRVLHGIFAEPSLVRLKQAIVEAVEDDAEPSSVAVEGEAARIAAGVLLRQLERRNGASDLLTRWRRALDV